MKLTIYVILLIFSCFFTSVFSENNHSYSKKVVQKIKLKNESRIEDPFNSYLNSIPIGKQEISQTTTGSGSAAITTRKFTFTSRGGVNTVYAILAFPQQAGIYPAIMCLHGGGGNADALINIVQRYAQNGYVAIASDLPGICSNTTTSYTTGPYKSRPLTEASRLDVSGGPQSSLLVDAEVAGLEAFNYMRSLTNVDTTKMGITGYSWGGYSTTMLTGLLRGKVKAAYSVFGSGFFEKGSFWQALITAMPSADRDIWLTYLDAGRRAPNITAPFFLECETNDTYFWPEAVEATLNAIPGFSNHSYGPNRNHVQLPSGSTMQQLFFDYYLKGSGQSFKTVVDVTNTENLSDGSCKLTIKIDKPIGVILDSVNLYYSEKATNWQVRNWKMLSTQFQSTGIFNAVIPADLVNKKVDYFIYVKDKRLVVTGSSMYNTANQIMGVNTTSHQSVNVYRQGSDLIISELDGGSYFIELINLSGKIVYSVHSSASDFANKKVFEISKLERGVYLVKVNLNGVLHTTKIIV